MSSLQQPAVDIEQHALLRVKRSRDEAPAETLFIETSHKRAREDFARRFGSHRLGQPAQDDESDPRSAIPQVLSHREAQELKRQQELQAMADQSKPVLFQYVTTVSARALRSQAGVQKVQSVIEQERLRRRQAVAFKANPFVKTAKERQTAARERNAEARYQWITARRHFDDGEDLDEQSGNEDPIANLGFRVYDLQRLAERQTPKLKAKSDQIVMNMIPLVRERLRMRGRDDTDPDEIANELPFVEAEQARHLAELERSFQAQRLDAQKAAAEMNHFGASDEDDGPRPPEVLRAADLPAASESAADESEPVVDIYMETTDATNPLSTPDAFPVIPFPEEALVDDGELSDDSNYYEDDDDENDENNYRNDYPDEDEYEEDNHRSDSDNDERVFDVINRLDSDVEEDDSDEEFDETSEIAASARAQYGADWMTRFRQWRERQERL
ncbi:hypothetical protein CAOG_005440 [Capsaspora owczarzaki ATCC 30864]|uniref:Probable RNA polymerase II nuclear localization protein SLC7A6OS n=2 Tax=Capsaspora owczarzaki (strain ATCC 30864) TaxID=595528 RepID=A0A0D2WS23_CAPO3|nr:hypothetical protein CAOG_005440 [Capsaspora owczarzaki ATCC 30864]